MLFTVSCRGDGFILRGPWPGPSDWCSSGRLPKCEWAEFSEIDWSSELVDEYGLISALSIESEDLLLKDVIMVWTDGVGGVIWSTAAGPSGVAAGELSTTAT